MLSWRSVRRGLGERWKRWRMEEIREEVRKEVLVWLLVMLRESGWRWGTEERLK